jgi:hypothetical protein
MANRISLELRDARRVSGGERVSTMRRTMHMKAARKRPVPMVAAFSQNRSRMVSLLSPLQYKYHPSYFGSG